MSGFTVKLRLPEAAPFHLRESSKETAAEFSGKRIQCGSQKMITLSAKRGSGWTASDESAAFRDRGSRRPDLGGLIQLGRCSFHFGNEPDPSQKLPAVRPEALQQPLRRQQNRHCGFGEDEEWRGNQQTGFARRNFSNDSIVC